MMKTKLIYSLILTIFSSILLAQTTIVLQNGQDAFIHSLPSLAGENFGENHQLTANAWTFSGEEGVIRGLIKYDLSFIPSDIEIVSATLSLYAIDSEAGFGQHNPLSGANACWLKKVTSPWEENTVTWLTQPSTSNINQVGIPSSTSPTQNFEVNVLGMVQSMVTNPTSNFGFMLKLKDENYYRRMNFASSNHDDINLRPKLTIVYSEINCITIQPDAEEGKDAVLHGLDSEVDKNFGENPQFIANAWTFSGREGIIRSVIDFDFSAIPNGAMINSAYLSLYAWDSTGGFEQHSTLSGSNACLLQRVVSEWSEEEVTWNTQPSTTPINEVLLPESNSSTQDYLDIDVLDLVKDMVENPSSSFGFLISLEDESYYRRMNFASSDHPNAALHPKLEICYSLVLNSEPLGNFDFNLFPNPSKNLIHVNLEGSFDTKIFLTIFNSQGQLVKRIENAQAMNLIDVSAFAPGLYYVHLQKDDVFLTKKFIVR